jgi:hypothetical protein
MMHLFDVMRTRNIQENVAINVPSKWANNRDIFSIISGSRSNFERKMMCPEKFQSPVTFLLGLGCKRGRILK